MEIESSRPAAWMPCTFLGNGFEEDDDDATAAAAAAAAAADVEGGEAE